MLPLSLQLHKTRKFSVLGSTLGVSSCSNGNRETAQILKLPLMAMKDLRWANAAHFMNLMTQHGFVVLREASSVAREHQSFIQELKRFFLEAEGEAKAGCRGPVYFNERGIPMWNTGYEKCGEMREAFRIQAACPDRQPWPSSELSSAWMSLMRQLQKVCDRALSLALGYTVTPPEEIGDDFSVCYALHYPNDEAKFKDELNVTEHCDPSLFVAEPCCGVEGLEVFDALSKSWVKVEARCEEGADVVVFAGKALQEASQQRIKATNHRVRRGPKRRFCVIYEQKYAQFYPPPLD